MAAALAAFFLAAPVAAGGEIPLADGIAVVVVCASEAEPMTCRPIKIPFKYRVGGAAGFKWGCARMTYAAVVEAGRRGLVVKHFACKQITVVADGRAVG